MDTEIAIVGISIELPSGPHAATNLDHEAFHQFLMDKKESYERIPAGLFNIDSWKGSGLAHIGVEQGSFLKDVDQFDNMEFGVSMRDAKYMAPATRKLLEHAFLALLDAGVDYRARCVGCYTSGNIWELSSMSEPDEYDVVGSFAGVPSMVANRISNHLDLLGPSLPTDTACSSSLTALHLAVQAILAGDCEAAVVAGCQLNTRFIDWFMYSQGGILSKDGKCKPFDASADGFARAEGAGAFVIKPLKAALRDHDKIYATVLGTGINSAGGAAPPSAPVAESQRDAMLQAFARAQKSPRDVDFVEAHATGTAKGDPTEANWIGEHFQRDDELLIGSLKGNIGHTEIVAFLASLSKAISAMKHGVIPPNINVGRINPAIHWDEYKMRVPMAPEPLPCRGERPLIAIASSGIGGSNGHALIQGPPALPDSRGQDVKDGPLLFMACGLSPRSASAVGEDVKAYVTKESTGLYATATVLGRRAKQMTWRSFAVADLSSLGAMSFSAPVYCERIPAPLVMIFSGQGPQHKDMGRALFNAFPVFRESVLEMDVVYKSATGKSLLADYGLFHGEPIPELSDVWPINMILPSIAVFQIALFDLLVSFGIKPDIIMGHSAGETAVFYASGAAPKAMVVELAVLRGMAFTALESLDATMAALSCGPEETSEMIAQYYAEGGQGTVEIACYNSPTAAAIAGHNRAIDGVLALAHKKDVFARKIRTRVPIHSSMMDACKEEYRAGLQALWKKYDCDCIPKITTYSTLTGERFEGPFDEDYFWKNTRGQVRFTQAMEALSRTSERFTFVENAPHPVLAAYISSMSSESSNVFATVRRAKPGKPLSEHSDTLALCGNVTVAGHSCVDFTALNGRACYELETPLPAYPFTKKQFALWPETPGTTKQFEARRGPLNHKHLKVNRETHPTLGQHVVRGEPIMPASGYIDMALEFGASSLMHLNLRTLLSLSSDPPLKVQVELDGCHWTVKSLTYPSVPVAAGARRKPTETLHADGYLSFEKPGQGPSLDLAAIRKRCPQFVDSEFYPSLSYFSTYGPRLQRVTNVYLGEDEALASIKGLDNALSREGNYVLHPAVLDACFHIMTYRPFHGDHNPNVYYLPASLRMLTLYESTRPKYFPEHVYTHVVSKKWTPDAMYYDIFITDDAGKCVCSMEHFEMARHRINPLPDVARPLDIVFQSASLQPSGASFKSRGESKNRSIHVTHFKKMLLVDGNELQQDIDTERENVSRTIARSLQTVREAIVSIKGSKHVIRVLITSSADLFLQEMRVMLADFPATFFELFVTNSSHSQLLGEDLRNGTVRITKAGLSPADVKDLPSSLDLVITVDTAEGDLSLDTLVQSCSEVIAPGGSLILTHGIQGSLSNSLDSLKAQTSLKIPMDVLRDAKFDVSSAECIETAAGSFLVTASRFIPMDVSHSSRPLSDATSPTIFDYTAGAETELQKALRLLSVEEHKDIWVLTREGVDSGSAKGLLRALAREYRSWTFRLLECPQMLVKQSALDIIRSLPIHLRDEVELRITADGDVQVPRMLVMPRVEPPFPGTSVKTSSMLAKNHVGISLLHRAVIGDVIGFVGQVLDSNGTKYTKGAVIAGLSSSNITSELVADVSTVVALSPRVGQLAHIIAASLPGFVAAVLACGLSTFQSVDRLRDLRVLVTQSDSKPAKTISFAYAAQGVKVELLGNSATLSELASLPAGRFDLVVSEYADKAQLQLLSILLKPATGKLFLWNDPKAGLLAVQGQDPCAFGDALSLAMKLIDANVALLSSRCQDNVQPSTTVVDSTESRINELPTFDSAKAYLLLGGIGSLGIHVALMMYQGGARNLVLTSRSGERSLHKNPISRRIMDYLKSRNDLTLRLEAADATSRAGMESLLRSIAQPLAGCMILTAALADGMFDGLQQSDFVMSAKAKLGVLTNVQDLVDVSTLDFVIGFSSVSAMFGIEGQSNYDASNAALEEALCTISNGFSFICPAIVDSSMMTAEDGGTFDYLASWAVSAEDMTCWLYDAIRRRRQGHRFKRYVPDLDWVTMDRTLGMPPLGKHVVPSWSDAEVSEDNRVDNIAGIVQRVLSLPAEDFSPEVPLTTYGLDSLSASRLAFALRSVVEVSQIQLLANMSLLDLQNRVSTTATETRSMQKTQTTEISTPELMRRMVAKYADSAILGAKRYADVPPPVEQVVLVTGTTGALGSHLIAQLLRMKETVRVYALNRRNSHGVLLRDRQAATLASQGLDPDIVNSPKLMLLESNIALRDFDVPPEVLKEMLGSVTHIIHNGWRVDFGTPLSGFEDLIQATRHLLDFCIQSPLPQRPSLSFISTIGVYLNTDIEPCAPEAPLLDATVPAMSGYTESKWVGERVVQIASEQGLVRTNVIRIGLVSGAPNGAWDTTHWVPALVQSAYHTGCLPDGNDLISWVPIDTTAAAVIDMRGTMNDTLHLVHPRPVTWDAIMKPLAGMLDVPLVPYREWLARLQSRVLDANEQPGGASIDALKLLDVYRFGVKELSPIKRAAAESMGMLPRVEIAKGKRASATLMDEALPQLGADHAERWVRYWRAVGYLSEP